MFYSLFAHQHDFLRVFYFITFRAAMACLTSLFISFFIGGPVLRLLRRLQKRGQPIRELGPERHLLEKKGTPTMGGLLILAALVPSVLLWARLSDPGILIVLFVTCAYGILGFADDYLKVSRYNTKGVPGKLKLAVQALVGLIAAYWLMQTGSGAEATGLSVPFMAGFFIDLGWFFIPFSALVMMGASNAVNLTDGLDGLATGSVVIVAAVFIVIAYLAGNSVFSGYLRIPFVPGAGELAVFCSALVGAGLGFLWYNAPPAAVFMGDTGSLALGGALGAVAVAVKHDIVLAIVGGLFVAETISVILQVFWYKRTKRRIFLMAPLHHHFEKKGWAEAKIVIRFWIITIILALIGLATLKLR